MGFWLQELALCAVCRNSVSKRCIPTTGQPHAEPAGIHEIWSSSLRALAMQACTDAGWRSEQRQFPFSNLSEEPDSETPLGQGCLQYTSE